MVTAGVAAAALVATTPARAEDGGRPILPSHPTAQHLPYTGSDCPTGDPACIVNTIAEMYRRVNAVVPVCDHRAPFALAYLRVTEEWHRRLAGGVFEDDAWTNRIDRVFADLYFQAYDDYAAGRRDQVPPSWRMALDAGRDRQVSALGNFFLEFNAHVNRDLVFALAKVGLTGPDGRSRKPDYDRGNSIVVDLSKPILAEFVERFDPTTDDLEVVRPFVVQVILGWRERTWRNAELLVAAPTPEARAAVAAHIENQVVTEGQLILETQRYRNAAEVARRDAWCAMHGGQRPAAYRPGAATLDIRRGRISTRASRARAPVACAHPSLGCKGTVRLTRGRRTLGRRSYALDAGAVKTVAVRLRRRDARGPAVVRLTRAGVPAPQRAARARVRLQRVP